jgi:hypothetical protein
LAEDESTPFYLGSERESTSKFNKFQVWELLRDKHFFPSSKNETRDPSNCQKIPNQLLDLLRTKHHGIHKITSEDSLNIYGMM